MGIKRRNKEKGALFCQDHLMETSSSKFHISNTAVKLQFKRSY